MILVWSDEAEKDLDNIYEYITRDSLYYAKQTIERIINRGKQIQAFPYSGVKVPEYNDPNIRQLWEKSYRIIFHIGDDRITILTIVHGARNILSDQ